MWQQRIQNYQPINEQEQRDQQAILLCIEQFDDVLMRDNPVAHMTASGFVVNAERTKVLMVYHHIYDSWSWTGGHADGETDFLALAMREVKEETGVDCRPLVEDIFSLEMLTVVGHVKKGAWVTPHLHMNVTYLLEADEAHETTVAEQENSAVSWLPIDRLADYVTEADMLPVYEKLIAKMKRL